MTLLQPRPRPRHITGVLVRCMSVSIMDIKLPNGETIRAQLKRTRSFTNSWFDSFRLTAQGTRLLEHPTSILHKQQQRSISKLRGLWHSACSGTPPGGVAAGLSTSAIHQDGTISPTAPSNQRATHLIVMANGLFGSPANWAVVCEHMRTHLDMDQVGNAVCREQLLRQGSMVYHSDTLWMSQCSVTG